MMIDDLSPDEMRHILLALSATPLWDGTYQHLPHAAVNMCERLVAAESLLRLKERRAMTDPTAAELLDEVERLRADNIILRSECNSARQATDHVMKDAKVEVDRLRTEAEIREAAYQAEIEARAKAEVEVERLRAEKNVLLDNLKPFLPQMVDEILGKTAR